MSPSRLVAGMKLAKPVLTKSGMVMLAEGTELTDSWIERIQDMDIQSVFVEGPPIQTVPKEEALSRLEARFAMSEGKPLMSGIKKLVKEHIESLYE